MAHTPSVNQGRERETAEAAARLHGMAEALSVLQRRGPAERQRAAEYAAELLAREVQPADWRRAGLPSSAPAGKTDGVPVNHQAILHLARTAMSLRCSGLPAVQRADLWARLAAFFAQIVPPGDPQFGRLREKALNARINAEDASLDVVDKLLGAYQRHARTEGCDAYLAGLARANLAIAYCQRGAGTDLDEAVRLCRQEIQARIDRYGADHSITLVARSLLVRCLLAQAEVTEDRGGRLRLAREAFDDADRVRAAGDRLFGVLSVTATLSRRYEGHALFLLGDMERARACLQYALAFDTARNGNREWLGSGHTHLLLARVHRALGDWQAALTHAKNACRLLAADTPGGLSRRAAEALLRELEPGSLS
jgi:tetratricopeptide (TPR) repeat protein